MSLSIRPANSLPLPQSSCSSAISIRPLVYPGRLINVRLRSGGYLRLFAGFGFRVRKQLLLRQRFMDGLRLLGREKPRGFREGPELLVQVGELGLIILDVLIRIVAIVLGRHPGRRRNLYLRAASRDVVRNLITAQIRTLGL